MKNLLDLSSNEIFILLEECFVESGYKNEYLRSVWLQTDVYNNEVRKYKENNVDILFTIKIGNKDLQSCSLRNLKNSEELKIQVDKYLKSLPAL